MSAVADVIAEVYARLDESREAGGLLEGWTFERQPVEVVQGLADKPSLHLSMPTFSEVQAGSRMAKPTVRITLGVSSRKIVTREGQDAIVEGIRAHGDDVEKVRKALEIPAGSPDPDVLFSGLLIEPMRFENSEARINSDSFGTGMVLVLPLRAIARGQR
jgi:hypothetical protein